MKGQWLCENNIVNEKRRLLDNLGQLLCTSDDNFFFTFVFFCNGKDYNKIQLFKINTTTNAHKQTEYRVQSAQYVHECHKNAKLACVEIDDKFILGNKKIIKPPAVRLLMESAREVMKKEGESIRMQAY